jgi:hypothetical protein
MAELNGNTSLDPPLSLVRLYLAMKRVIAAILLACLGMMIPLAGSPLRLCLLENRLLVGGSECGMEKEPCCPDCGDPHENPCCVELEELPDAPAPVVPDDLPAPPVMDLPEPAFAAPPPARAACLTHPAATPIRGPDTPAAHRAWLGVWRL